MVERHCQGDQGAERVTDQGRALDTHAGQRLAKQLGLRGWRPETIARPFAMAETRTVEGEDTVASGQRRHQPARLEILQRDGIAV